MGKKILKILVFKIVDETGQYIGDKLARLVEDRIRRPHLRTFTPDGYALAPQVSPPAPRIDDLAQGRSLLFVHGFISSSYGAFHGLPQVVFDELYRRYEGRVFAFDHPTISHSPVENVAWLGGELQALGERRLELDIVSHSRGGLVSRLLTEKPELTDGRLDVGRLVMVGTPNAGTVLADDQKLSQLTDRFTNLLALAPGVGVTDSLALILALAKQFAIGAFKGLDGVMSMNPQGSFLTSVLNTPSATSATYFAAASDFEPVPGSPLFRIACQKVADTVIDYVFGQEHNDLVVPTDGVFTLPPGTGAQLFPIEEPLVFGSTQGVDHSGYWEVPAFTDALLGWLDR